MELAAMWRKTTIQHYNLGKRMNLRNCSPTSGETVRRPSRRGHLFSLSRGHRARSHATVTEALSRGLVSFLERPVDSCIACDLRRGSGRNLWRCSGQMGGSRSRCTRRPTCNGRSQRCHAGRRRAPLLACRSLMSRRWAIPNRPSSAAGHAPCFSVGCVSRG